MVIEFDAPLLKWGNSYALRITRKQAEELGARPGVPLHARLEAVGRPKLVLPTFHGGQDAPSGSTHHDELAAEQAWEDLQRGRRR